MRIDDSEILTAGQKNFLGRFRDTALCERYYLSGGTALAAFHLFHRYSEDIDLFASEHAPLEQILAFLKSLAAPDGVKYERKFDRRIFMLTLPDGETLKLEFTRYPFARMEEGIVTDGILVDGIRDILMNKAVAIADRRDAKDFVDLYFGLIHLGDPGIDRLIAGAEHKFGVRGIEHSLCGAFLQGVPPIDGLRMRQPVRQDALHAFFRQIAEACIAKRVADEQ